MEDKKQILEHSGFKCQKCGYYSPLGKGLEVVNNSAVLCSVCAVFCPEGEELSEYINEAVEWSSLEPFRKYGANKGSRTNQKTGMLKKYSEGNIMARPAYGYKVEAGKLVLDQEASLVVKEIFDDFLNSMSMNQIAKKYEFSVNGIKKILKNFTYIGKVKFDNQIIQGQHAPIISPDVFNRVQSRFELSSKKEE